MRRAQLAAHHDMCAWCAEVRGRPQRAIPRPAQKLHFDRNRKVLVLDHRGRRLRMQHQAVVAHGPSKSGTRRGQLFTDKPVLGRDQVVRKRVLVEQVAKLAREGGPFVVPHFQEALFHAEGVVQIDPKLVLRELGRPPRQVLAIKELNPLESRPSHLRVRRGGGHRQQTRNQDLLHVAEVIALRRCRLPIRRDKCAPRGSGREWRRCRVRRPRWPPWPARRPWRHRRRSRVR